jgi:tRNA modification GTPase
LISEIAGTTRYTVEEYLNIQVVLFKLIDTAGIRSATQDSIEQMGIDEIKEKILDADIVIALFDVNDEGLYQISAWQSEVSADKLVLVGNKKDLLKDKTILTDTSLQEVVFISAKEKENIKALEIYYFKKQ